MTRRRRDPLAGCRRLLIDGSNQRGQSEESLPEDVLVGSLSRLFAASIELIAVFDTDPPIGAGTKRVIGRVTVVHARAGGGDDAIIALLRQRPEGTVVVTDDADLRRRVTELGGGVERNDWLRNRREYGRLVASSIGRRMIFPLSTPAGDTDDSEADRPAWRPGRGATQKRGPARRSGRDRQRG